MKTSLCLSLFVLVLCSACSEFSYSVKAEGGGEQGFNNVVCNGNNLSAAYSLVMKNPGYEKRGHCCIDDFNADVKSLIRYCDSLCDIGMPAEGSFTVGNYTATYTVKDRHNYEYRIE